MPLPPVALAKITPPPGGPRILPRTRLQARLSEARQHRLTIVQAGAGYGKSTALAELSGKGGPLVWYQVLEEDRDPFVFLLHLALAARRALPGLEGLPLALLEAWDGSRGPLPQKQVSDQILNALAGRPEEEVLLVIDDVHLALEASEIALLLDRFIGLAPPNLHVLLATRPPLKLPNLSRWRAQGEVLSIDQQVLAFTAAEIGALFSQHYGYELTAEESADLYTATEGWAIALQLVWQSLRSRSPLAVDESLARRANSLESLFELLTSEVFASQPEDVQRFLLACASLRELTPAACMALLEEPGVGAMLEYLQRQELFVRAVPPAEGEALRLRFHPIFHHYLRQRSSPEERRAYHCRAARYYQEQGAADEAIYHYLEAGESEAAAGLLQEYGAQLLADGRLDTLQTYLDRMPVEVLGSHPALLVQLGDLARLHSHFHEALGFFQQAESLYHARGQTEGRLRALRGQARVYLDTVNAPQAEAILEETLRLSDGITGRDAQARLYELLAENRLNAGKVADAERLRQQAATLRDEGPSDAQLLYRVLLRTGRLAEARQKLAASALEERRHPVQTPRAHRETQLLLSLVYAFMGEAGPAGETALEGTRRGTELGSPFITAVGHIRQGHAHLLSAAPDRFSLARAQYERAIELSHQLEVPRLLVETYWGLVRCTGYQGELAEARALALKGQELALQAGDEWVASLVRLAFGASLTLAALHAGGPQAAEGENWLIQAGRGFQECSDPFGYSAARLWLCLGWACRGEGQQVWQRLAQALPDLLALASRHGYDFLFSRPTLLGLPDERLAVPLLIQARDRGWEAAYAARLLEALGLTGISHHPGYRLRVQSLGVFNVWQGERLLAVQAWRREKARQLFQLLLTQRSAPLDREQIFEYLWPETDPAAAARSFKVTLNTLYQVLEPEREPGQPSAYILREGSVYSLRPDCDLELDVDGFTSLIARAEALQASDSATQRALLSRAVALYQGEYLLEARYETWAAAEREHLAVLFLRAADRLAELLLEAGELEAARDTCGRILAQDNCWERAYRTLMQIYTRLGDHGQVARTYRRCVDTLKQELEVEPAPETRQLYEELIRPH